MGKYRPNWSMIVIGILLGLLLTGCSGGSSIDTESATQTAGANEAEQTVEPTKLPVTTDYDVPAEDAGIVNPIAADEASLERGGEIYEATCIKCHGEQGDGKGPTASRLNPEPADFRAEHVTTLSDGELLYIITNGIEDSAMIPFNFLDEDKRWHLVNYIRSFQE